MDAAVIVPTVVAAQVLAIQFEAPCHYCRGYRLATTNIRPVDAIGSSMIADLYVRRAHAGDLVARARIKGSQGLGMAADDEGREGSGSNLGNGQTHSPRLPFLWGQALELYEDRSWNAPHAPDLYCARQLALF